MVSGAGRRADALRERDSTVVCTSVLAEGDSVWVPPWTVHGTLNLSTAPARFEVAGLPGAMSGYFAEAGVLVCDGETLVGQAARPVRAAGHCRALGIEFWTADRHRSGHEHTLSAARCIIGIGGCDLRAI